MDFLDKDLQTIVEGCTAHARPWGRCKGQRHPSIIQAGFASFSALLEGRFGENRPHFVDSAVASCLHGEGQERWLGGLGLTAQSADCNQEEMKC